MGEPRTITRSVSTPASSPGQPWAHLAVLHQVPMRRRLPGLPGIRLTYLASPREIGSISEGAAGTPAHPFEDHSARRSGTVPNLGGMLLRPPLPVRPIYRSHPCQLGRRDDPAQV